MAGDDQMAVPDVHAFDDAVSYGKCLILLQGVDDLALRFSDAAGAGFRTQRVAELAGPDQVLVRELGVISAGVELDLIEIDALAVVPGIEDIVRSRAVYIEGDFRLRVQLEVKVAALRADVVVDEVYPGRDIDLVSSHEVETAVDAAAATPAADIRLRQTLENNRARGGGVLDRDASRETACCDRCTEAPGWDTKHLCAVLDVQQVVGSHIDRRVCLPLIVAV